jgi:hypothetical protein
MNSQVICSYILLQQREILDNFRYWCTGRHWIMLIGSYFLCEMLRLYVHLHIYSSTLTIILPINFVLCKYTVACRLNLILNSIDKIYKLKIHTISFFNKQLITQQNGMKHKTKIKIWNTYNSSTIICILPPWRRPHGSPKHIGGHCVYKLI